MGHVTRAGSEPGVRGSTQSCSALGRAPWVRAQAGGGACGPSLRRALGRRRGPNGAEGEEGPPPPFSPPPPPPPPPARLGWRRRGSRMTRGGAPRP